jgi:hypothetical protein
VHASELIRAVQEAEYLFNERCTRQDGALRSFTQEKSLALSLPDDEAAVIERGSVFVEPCYYL